METVKVHFPYGTAWKDHHGPCDAVVSVEDARLLLAGNGGVTLCEGETLPSEAPVFPEGDGE